METFLTVEHAYAYGIDLQPARHLTEEERQNYRPEFWDTIFIGMGEHIPLDYVSWEELHEALGNRRSDGDFLGCGNAAWIITQDEWDALLSINERNRKAAEEKKRLEEIEWREDAKKRAEAQMVNGKLPSKEEAKRKSVEYNNIHNEGGFGFVPHFFAAEEYEANCARLKELKGEG